jgi:hypothetical protein
MIGEIVPIFSGPFAATKTGIIRVDGEITRESWLKGCCYLANAARGLAWAIGDWINTLRLAAEFAGLDGEDLDKDTEFNETLSHGYDRLSLKTGSQFLL